MNTRVRFKTFDQLSVADHMVYSKLPSHPFWSRIEEKIDFSFADQLCAVLYTGRGARPYAPSLKLKIHLVQAYYALSDRLVEEKIIGDLFIKRFLQLPVDFFGFDHSTIGLDRSRMGTPMFQACHLYILAQMYSLGLWGDHDEQWIIDSFPCHIGVVMVGAYRLIQQSMLRVVQHLKRSFPLLYSHATQSLLLDSLTYRLPAQASVNDQMLAFSKLVAEAYALLHWMDTEAVAESLRTWRNEQAKQKFHERRILLEQILTETSRPTPPPDRAAKHDEESVFVEEPKTMLDSEGGQAASAPNATIQYEKIPRSDRSVRRISAHAPDARLGVKNRYTLIKGFKVQNLCSTSSVILDTRVIPAAEPDRDTMVDMVHGIQSFLHVTPLSLLGDTAYGYGKQRIELDRLGIKTIAPVPTRNPPGLFNVSQFTYNREHNVYTCPNNKESIRIYDQPKLEGFQYEFRKSDCLSCPLKSECTTSKGGRRVFHSYFFDLYDAARTFNESEEGREAEKLRYLVERKNQELKNDCGLGHPEAREQKTLQMKSTLAAIVVNLKLTVRRLFAPSPGFNRRGQVT